jgi:hypothetical protein
METELTVVITEEVAAQSVAELLVIKEKVEQLELYGQEI